MNRISVLARVALLAAGLGLLATATAMADLPGPGPRPHPPIPEPQPQPPNPAPATGAVPMVIRVDPQATQSVLKIPQRLLPAQVGLNQPAPSSRIARNVVAGFALSLALGGVFLASRRRNVRAAIAAIVFCGAVVAAATLSADIPGPGPKPEPNANPITLPLANKVSGQVVVVFTDKADAPVVLVLAGKNAGAPGAAPSDGSRIQLVPPAPAAPPAPSP